jgi:hypothetical protein
MWNRFCTFQWVRRDATELLNIIAGGDGRKWPAIELAACELRIRTRERNHPRSRAGAPEDTVVRRQEETQLMESAMNSTLVLLALYICSNLHNGHKTIIEFIARLPLETEEKDEGLDP